MAKYIKNIDRINAKFMFKFALREKLGAMGISFSDSPCGHLAITDTPIIRTAGKYPTKINYRRLTEINSRYYGLSLLN